MPDQMNQDEKDLYLDVLKEGATPFDRFVSRGSMQDAVDIPGPRKNVDPYFFRAIRQTLQDKSTRLLPIIGSAGCGKTHAYWAYKAIEKRLSDVKKGIVDSDLPSNLPENWSIVYIPSPPAATRILFHCYTCLLDELTVDVLKTVAEKLIDRWGGFKKKKLGLFGGQDIEETIQVGIREYPGIFADAVKNLCIFVMDKERSPLAERWLLGEQLDDAELETLGVNSVIEDDDICLAMIKLICENAGKVIILYYDELESPYRMHGPEAEQKFLEILKRLYNEIKNVVIVTAVLKEIWPRLQEIMDQALRSRMEPERELKLFTLDDLLLYFAKAMAFFWSQNNLNPPADPLFPLNEAVLRILFNKTDGNARSIIKLIRMFIDKILEEDMTLEELVKESEKAPEVKETPEINASATATAGNTPAGALKPSTSSSPEPSNTSASAASSTPTNLMSQVEEMMKNEIYVIEANPSYVTGATLKSIKVLAEKFGKTVKIEQEYKFTIGKRSYSLPGMIEYNGKKHGVDIPAIKSFDRSGGVAAFYAAKRLTDAISTNIIEFGILIVPKGTGGAKYVSLLKRFAEKVYVFELSEDSAKFLIKQAIQQPSKEAYALVTHIFGPLPPYDAPVPPYDENKEVIASDDEEEGKEPAASTEPKSASTPAPAPASPSAETKTANTPAPAPASTPATQKPEEKKPASGTPPASDNK